MDRSDRRTVMVLGKKYSVAERDRWAGLMRSNRYVAADREGEEWVGVAEVDVGDDGDAGEFAFGCHDRCERLAIHVCLRLESADEECSNRVEVGLLRERGEVTVERLDA